MQTTRVNHCLTMGGDPLINSLFMGQQDEEKTIPAGPLRARVEGKRGDKAEFARRMGVQQAVITNWLRRGVPESRLRIVCAELGITVDDYLREAGIPIAETPTGTRYPVRETPFPYAERVDTIPVPVLDVAASMGLGLAMPEHDTVVDHLRLTRTWVSRHLPNVSSSHSLSVISAYGDSMTPTFHDGDILLVDRGITQLKLDAVYVLAFNDELYIKRIQRRPDGSIAIISDNKVYDPIIVPADEKENVRVLGRVLWAWNGKKL